MALLVTAKKKQMASIDILERINNPSGLCDCERVHITNIISLLQGAESPEN